VSTRRSSAQLRSNPEPDVSPHDRLRRLVGVRRSIAHYRNAPRPAPLLSLRSGTKPPDLAEWQLAYDLAVSLANAGVTLSVNHQQPVAELRRSTPLGTLLQEATASCANVYRRVRGATAIVNGLRRRNPHARLLESWAAPEHGDPFMYDQEAMKPSAERYAFALLDPPLRVFSEDLVRLPDDIRRQQRGRYLKHLARLAARGGGISVPVAAAAIARADEILRGL